MEKVARDGAVVANLQYGGEYQQQLEASARTGECIFCNDHGDSRGGVALERRGKWYIRLNKFPPKGRDAQTPARQALLIVPVRHICWTHEMDLYDIADVWGLFLLAKRKLVLPGGVLALRFDAPEDSGRTIMHLHFHVICPGINPVTGKADPIPFWVG